MLVKDDTRDRDTRSTIYNYTQNIIRSVENVLIRNTEDYIHFNVCRVDGTLADIRCWQALWRLEKRLKWLLPGK